MNRQSKKITWLFGTALAIALNAPVYSDNGLIVITREVQPRAATRKELAPDPHPLTVQAGLPQSANSAINSSELDDSEFAHINTGLSVSNRVLTGQTNRLSSSSSMTKSGGNGIPGLGAAIGGDAAGGRGATGGISGRVNGAVQTGLRPLQNMSMGN